MENCSTIINSQRMDRRREERKGRERDERKGKEMGEEEGKGHVDQGEERKGRK